MTKEDGFVSRVSEKLLKARRKPPGEQCHYNYYHVASVAFHGHLLWRSLTTLWTTSYLEHSKFLLLRFRTVRPPSVSCLDSTAFPNSSPTHLQHYYSHLFVLVTRFIALDFHYFLSRWLIRNLSGSDISWNFSLFFLGSRSFHHVTVAGGKWRPVYSSWLTTWQVCRLIRHQGRWLTYCDRYWPNTSAVCSAFLKLNF